MRNVITSLNIFKRLALDYYVNNVMHFPMSKHHCYWGNLENCVNKLILLHCVYIEELFAMSQI